MTPRSARRLAVQPTNSPAAVTRERQTRRRALIPRDCWADAWHSATRTVGGLALAVAVLAFIVATEPWGAWLLNHSTFGAH